MSEARDAAERTAWTSRPAPAAVVAGPLWFWALLIATSLTGAATNASWDPEGVRWPLIAGALVALGTARLLWEAAGWFAARYTLTDRRVVARWGILTRAEIGIPLHKVQSVRIVRRLRDRILGLGSIGISSAGVGSGSGIEVWWIMVAEPDAVAARVRAALPHPPTPTTPTTPSPPPASPVEAGKPAQPTVLGLTGSIGGGKSTAAALLAGMGCIVVDSDAEAKAALDRPEVRESLLAWWGPAVVGPDGRVDRAAVAAIIFEKPEERARLERLVHPIVRKSRAELVDRAKASGAGVVVVDVPLLYEAGVDKECDAVAFVDAPRPERVRRVSARGWTEDELSRREAAQWPVERKKSLADERIDNAGTVEDLRAALAAMLERVKARPRRSG